MSLDTIIDFKDVPVFQKSNLVLNSTSFEISKGEFVYIIGRTGTGKSSAFPDFCILAYSAGASIDSSR